MPEWLTYSELAERFDSTPEAMRQRSLRGNWRKQTNNEGKTIVLLPEDFTVRPRKKRNVRSNNSSEKPVKQNNVNKDLERLIAVLEAHVVSLERELAFVRDQLNAEKQAAEESLIFVKKLSEELSELKSAKNNVRQIQKTIETALPAEQAASSETPITGMSAILKRLELLKAAKTAAG